MKRFLFQPIKLFRFKSVFSTILISMITLCVALCFCFAFFFTKLIIMSTREQKVKTDLIFLNSLVGDTDYLISSLHQSLTQLSYAHDVLCLPFFRNMENGNISQVQTDLALSTDNNNFVAATFLHLPGFTKVITSSFRMFDPADFPLQGVIDYYSSETMESVIIRGDGKMSCLFSLGRDIFIARDFPLTGEAKLATLFYRLNTLALYRHITDKLGDDTNLWIYDERNRPVFFNDIKYPEKVTTIGIIKSIEDSGNEYYQKDGTRYLLLGSPITGWKYLYESDEPPIRPSAKYIIAILSPIILIIIIAASLVSFIIASILYRPFRRLLNVMESRNLAPNALESSTNEFEYLNFAFTHITSHQSELENLMAEVSSDIVSKLFLDLLSGAQTDVGKVKQILSNTNSLFKANAPYVSCALYWAGEHSQSESQRLVILSELRDIMSSFNKRYDTLSLVLVLDAKTFSIILSFLEDSFLMQVKKALQDLEASISLLARRQSVRLLFFSGNLYHSILDIGFSYSEALSRLSVMKQTNDLITFPKIESRSLPDDRRFDKRAEQILSLILANDAQSALMLTERVLEEITGSNQDPEEQRNYCKNFLNSMENRIADSENFDFSSLPNNLFAFPVEETAQTDKTDLLDLTKGICKKIIDKLAAIHKKHQNHFIVAAQEYIRLNYRDKNISLSSTAEEIGIHPNYLSTLFKEKIGVTFTDFMNNVRISNSIVLLLNTKKTVKAIAEESGFNSVQSFIRVFKRKEKMTPGQYRETGISRGTKQADAGDSGKNL